MEEVILLHQAITHMQIVFHLKETEQLKQEHYPKLGAIYLELANLYSRGLQYEKSADYFRMAMEAMLKIREFAGPALLLNQLRMAEANEKAKIEGAASELFLKLVLPDTSFDIYCPQSSVDEIRGEGKFDDIEEIKKYFLGGIFYIIYFEVAVLGYARNRMVCENAPPEEIETMLSRIKKGLNEKVLRVQNGALWTTEEGKDIKLFDLETVAATNQTSPASSAVLDSNNSHTLVPSDYLTNGVGALIDGRIVRLQKQDAISQVAQSLQLRNLDYLCGVLEKFIIPGKIRIDSIIHRTPLDIFKNLISETIQAISLPEETRPIEQIVGELLQDKSSKRLSELSIKGESFAGIVEASLRYPYVIPASIIDEQALEKHVKKRGGAF